MSVAPRDSYPGSAGPAASDRLDQMASDLLGEAFCADWHGDPDKGVREVARIKKLFVQKLMEFACDEIARSRPHAQQPKLTEEEKHAIGHARYQAERATPEFPELCFDYELILTLLRIIDRLNDRLGIAQKIIAEYQAGTIAGARGRSMPDSGAWQPIETYDPRHELNVLVVDEGVVSEAYYNGESDAWFKEGKSEHDFDFVDSDRLFPTHWMPMPAPPSPVTSTEGK